VLSASPASLIIEAVDKGDVTILALFDLSAAFDAVDHTITLLGLIAGLYTCIFYLVFHHR
jgi:hypothetical protein